MDKIKIVCRALIINGQNKILLVRKTGSDFWNLPGGKLDADDESLQTCLIRELKEELGVEPKLNKDVRFVLELHKDNVRYVELIWEATLLNDPGDHQKNIYEISDNELSDIRWFKKNDLHRISVKPEFLKEIL